MNRTMQQADGTRRKIHARKRIGRRRSRVMFETLEPRLMLSTVPNDPMFPQQWHLNNTGQYAEDTGSFYGQGGSVGADINAEKAWDITTGSDDVVIGILDSGVDITHPDLAANVFTNTKEIPGNGIDDDGNGFVDDVHGWNFTDNNADVTDYLGHGTHVAGIIGATGDNGVGVTGVNWDVKLLPLKIGSAAPDFNAAVAGIEYAVALKHSGVNIVAINASFGGYAPVYSPLFDQALHDAADAGILFVVAAGNNGQNNDPSQIFPAKYSQNNPNVITVAATDNQDNLAQFSNYGQASVNVAAPGVAITSTWSRMVDDNGDQTPDQVEYKTISGTSMAAPVVTGILALEAAAKPNATMLQLKDALLSSVKPLPSLQDMFYNSPNLVTTGGRVDAYHAILNLLNQHVGDDTATGGNWIGNYGSEGQYVIGLANSAPDYVGMLLRGDDMSVIPPFGNSLVQGEVLTANSPKPSALQITSDPAHRIVGRFATDTRMYLDMNFTDGQTHRVTFYVADTENAGRMEEFIVQNADDGQMLAYQGVWDFKNGRYITFDLTGHVLVQIHNTSPHANAVLNGIFFDASPQAPNLFVKEDDTTGGAWRNLYGSQGSHVVGMSTETPSFLGMLLEGDATGRLRTAKGPQVMDNPDITAPNRTLGYYATPTSMTFDMYFTDEQVHQVGVYFVDDKRAGRTERVDILDAGGNVLDSRIVSDFGDGKYLFWNLQGHQKIRITRLAGPDAVVSGFVFDAPAGGPVQFVGSDRGTQGNWHGSYGYDGAVVFGDESASYLPAYADVSIEDGNRSEQVVEAFTQNPRAPQLVDSLTNRMVTYLHTTSQMTLDINITDNQTHRFSIYALDWDKQQRVERIEWIDPQTGQVVSSQDIANFENGLYLSWNIRGDMQMRITRLAGPTAPISAFYFG